MKTKIALTFDIEFDLPVIDDLLELLKKYNIRGTFFLLGRLVDKHPEIPTKILSYGHEIGCHGYNHDPPYDKRSLTSVKMDVKKGTKILQQVVEVTSFRSPYFRPHKKLVSILESFDYCIDSSVPTKRFDFFLGRTNNLQALTAPRMPYLPSRNNIFKKGNSGLVEIPLTCVIFPLMGTTLRNLGLITFICFINLARHIYNNIVVDLHLWEFVEGTQASYRHRRRRGKKLWIMFDRLLFHLKNNNYVLTPISKLLNS
ncbi:MAG: polysaccharide deacetylase family protein [Candidatus Hodarchaeota archaeon]